MEIRLYLYINLGIRYSFSVESLHLILSLHLIFILFISILCLVFSIQVLHLFIRAISKYFALLSDYRWYYNLNFDFSW